MFGLAVVASFCAGIVVTPSVRVGISSAHGEAALLVAEVIYLAGMKHANLPGTPNPEMNARGLVTTDNATIGIQSGNVAKRMHPKTDEIQYIIAGSGAMWLGNERREFKPGSLIVIPRGTAHAGTLVSRDPGKVIAIKIPPQPKDDVVFLK
jgi:mannose-6-phosphate isomerase-like protein (cupin superfamily)